MGKLRITADLDTYTTGGGTIPPDIVATSQTPDLVLVWPDDKEICLIELTVPFERNIQGAHQFKTDRYSSLVSDINNTEWSCSMAAVEIGSRGLITKENKSRITYICKKLICDVKYKDLKSKLSKSALTSSYSIFLARQEENWNIQSYIKRALCIDQF